MNLSKDFWNEEIISGHCVYKETKEVWAVNLELLKFFQRFCDEHKLRYFMGFGTLLGSVRHQGFIPWDDDVDIMMPREDFDRLKSKASEIKKPYFLQTEETDTGYWHGGMIKLRNSNTACIGKKDFYAEFNQGIGIDILPLDYAPKPGVFQKMHALLIYIYQYLIWLKYYLAKICQPGYHENFTDRFMRYIGSGIFFVIKCVLPEVYLKKKLFLLQTAYQRSKTQYLAIYTSLCWNKKVMPLDIFQGTVNMIFENLTLPAPIKIRACLEIQYGKYFLNRVEQRWRLSRHPALWAVDESYVAYQERFNDIFKDTKGKIIVLFGTGNMVKNYHQQTGRKFEPQFYVDNSAEKWETEIYGKKIKSPDFLKSIPENKLHLIICNNYYREIGQQLKKMGIKKYYIYTDNFDALFGSPNEMGLFSRKKLYERSCVCFGINSYSLSLYKFLKQAKMKSEHVFVMIKYSEEDSVEYAQKIKSVLQDLEILDGVIYLSDLEMEDLCELYEFEALFLFKEEKQTFIEKSIVKNIAIEYF